MRAPILFAAVLSACSSNPGPAQPVPPEIEPLPATPVAAEQTDAPTDTQPASTTQSPLVADYAAVAADIARAAMASDGAWEKLQYLTDRIGPRLAGSKNLERAITWAAETLKAEGHENVRLDEVKVPHWVRGEEYARIAAPVERELTVIGLGGTVATPRRGLTAPLVIVEDFADLDDSVKGKIVLFNKRMPDYDHETAGDAYGAVSKFRMDGPRQAATHGAAAVLVRSLTTRSLATPHTGVTDYGDAERPIPALAVTTEDADLLERLADAGEPVKVTVKTSGRYLKDAVSHNVLAELVGRETPEQIVVIGAHIDAWDVGQGAHDDATGVAMMMQALTILRELDLRPRRTIRVVLFTNEENGMRGAFDYAKRHANEDHVAAMESDSGGFDPIGFQVQGSDAALADARDISPLLQVVDASRIEKGFGGVDLIPLAAKGIPALGVWVREDHYFDLHHTAADTLDKVDPTDLKENVAAVAIMAYVIADMPERFGRAAE